MAVSHVWSDGTGTGAWRDGEVNECLYSYFRGIAEHFQCEGIWWDALCIPRAKAARNKAIQKIQTNYQDARVTLVHDCFLRNWDWDPETACFGILMSPWFSRGWTALELAKSRKVKVIFKGRYGPVIKDLDEEILAKEDETSVPRIKASRMIRNLRKEFTSLNDLLTVLRHRFTSWPKDMAVISALLVGIAPEEQQQKTYRNILRKIGELRPDNLFHNAATMSNEFSWCPTSLFKMPLDRSSEVRLKILEDGIRGKWRISRHYVETVLEKNCLWHSSHPLIKRQLQDAMKRPKGCRLLTKCGTGPVEKALLVRESRGARYQYLGALYFRQELTATSADDWIEEDVILCGVQDDDEPMHHPGPDRSTRDAEGVIHTGSHQEERSSHPLDVKDLKQAVWRGECDYSAFSEMVGRVDPEIPDCLGRRLLHLAAERGDKQYVESLLISNVDMEAQCNDGQTALHCASWGGSESVVRLLLEHGSDVTVKDKNGNTALHIAARMGFESIVRLFLEKRALVNAEGRHSLTPLHYATMKGHKAVAELLLKEGAKVNAKDSMIGWAPLHCAAEIGDESLAELLIQSGANANERDCKVGWTPLHFAAMNGHESTVQLLIRQGANGKAKDMYGWMPQQFAVLNGRGHSREVELPSREGETSPIADRGRLTPIHCIAINSQLVLLKLLDGNGTGIDFPSQEENWSPLLFAAQNGLSALIDMLLETSATIEVEDETGRTPLCWAALEGHHTFAKLLLEKGAKIEAKDHYNTTPLIHAAVNGHESVVTLLLENGANFEAADDGGQTPLVCAAKNGYEGVVTLLLEKGANIEAVADSGQSPLACAVKNGHEDVVTLLLEKGANIEAANNGRTALHLAAGKGQVTLVTLLLEKGANIEAAAKYDGTPLGANIEAVADSGQTPLVCAAKNGHEGVVTLLLEKGANIEAAAKIDGTPLICAAENGHESVVTLLLEKGANIEAANFIDRTALHFAAGGGQVTLVTLLLEKGANIEAVDRFGGTPLCLAAASGHVSVSTLLLERGANIEAGAHLIGTPLCLAAGQGHETVVTLLLEKGANIEEEGELCGTPLVCAAENAHESVFTLLLEWGANIEAREYRNRTPLHFAIERGAENIVKLLLEKGAIIETADRLSRTPICPDEGYKNLTDWYFDMGRKHCGKSSLRLAAEMGHVTIVKLLLEKGANTKATPRFGQSLLCWAIAQGHWAPPWLDPPKTVIADNGTNDRDPWRPRRQMGRPHTILGREQLRRARRTGSGCTEVEGGEEGILGTRCQDGGVRAIAMALEVTLAIRNPLGSPLHSEGDHLVDGLTPRQGAQLQSARSQDMQASRAARSRSRRPRRVRCRALDQQILATALKRRDHRSVGQATRRLVRLPRKASIQEREEHAWESRLSHLAY
ncbi:isoform Er16 of ankyrin-1 [Aspergillus udagawae]|uniref:Isoform Er16 of ankyrin-1 n=1 Tax=Aspergillus udagawae TaxID=91492 RepID=A0ABQ1B8Q2_9EURO|nr:isoform Er16 of ankyrin-1 [Aspergillus udagawae]